MFKFTPKCSKYLVCDLSEQMLPFETYAMDFHQAAERAADFWEDDWFNLHTCRNQTFSVQIEHLRSGEYEHGTIGWHESDEQMRWIYETKEKSY